MEMKTKLLIAFVGCLVAVVIVLAYLPREGQEPLVVERETVQEPVVRAAPPVSETRKPLAPERASKRPLSVGPKLASHAPDSMPKRLEKMPTLERSQSGAIRQTGPGSQSGYAPTFPSGRGGEGSGSGYVSPKRASSGVRDVRGDFQRYTPPERQDRRYITNESSYAPGIVVVGDEIFATETEYRAVRRRRAAGIQGDLQASYERWRAQEERKEMLQKQAEEQGR